MKKHLLFLSIVLFAVIAGFNSAVMVVAAESASSEQPPTYYFISDLHIGGDGALNECQFETELIDFLKKIADTPNAELIIVGDAFGLWELTLIKGDTKILHLADTHAKLFAQFRETGENIRITLIPGNHDYELACIPAYREQLGEYNIAVEPVEHVIREIAGRKIWIEHGNQRDSFNTFPDFGNPYGQPSGYYITTGTVATSGRGAERGRSKWLNDLQSVYPNEEIPFWIWSNYVYKEMSRFLLWFFLPFILLFSVSLIIFIGRLLEKFGILRTKFFNTRFSKRLGVAGRLIDIIIWINTTVISFMLILSIPLYFLGRDVRSALKRYGVGGSPDLKVEKDKSYVDAAKAVFQQDPSVAAFVYGHTHIPSLREVDGHYIINTGTWLKRLDRVPSRVRLMPDVYVPSFTLSCFTISEKNDDISIIYSVEPKETPRELTLLQRMLIIGRRPSSLAPIPEKTIISAVKD
jgi:UDP-2,3-diacylglucosamine pyrophosphatase LpxH